MELSKQLIINELSKGATELIFVNSGDDAVFTKELLSAFGKFKTVKAFEDIGNSNEELAYIVVVGKNVDWRVPESGNIKWMFGQAVVSEIMTNQNKSVPWNNKFIESLVLGGKSYYFVGNSVMTAELILRNNGLVVFDIQVKRLPDVEGIIFCQDSEEHMENKYSSREVKKLLKLKVKKALCITDFEVRRLGAKGLASGKPKAVCPLFAGLYFFLPKSLEKMALSMMNLGGNLADTIETNSCVVVNDLEESKTESEISTTLLLRMRKKDVLTISAKALKKAISTNQFVSEEELYHPGPRLVPLYRTIRLNMFGHRFFVESSSTTLHKKLDELKTFGCESVGSREWADSILCNFATREKLDERFCTEACLDKWLVRKIPHACPATHRPVYIGPHLWNSLKGMAIVFVAKDDYSTKQMLDAATLMGAKNVSLDTNLKSQSKQSNATVIWDGQTSMVNVHNAVKAGTQVIRTEYISALVESDPEKSPPSAKHFVVNLENSSTKQTTTSAAVDVAQSSTNRTSDEDNHMSIDLSDLPNIAGGNDALKTPGGNRSLNSNASTMKKQDFKIKARTKNQEPNLQTSKQKAQKTATKNTSVNPDGTVSERVEDAAKSKQSSASPFSLRALNSELLSIKDKQSTDNISNAKNSSVVNITANNPKPPQPGPNNCRPKKRKHDEANAPIYQDSTFAKVTRPNTSDSPMDVSISDVKYMVPAETKPTNSVTSNELAVQIQLQSFWYEMCLKLGLNPVAENDFPKAKNGLKKLAGNATKDGVFTFYGDCFVSKILFEACVKVLPVASVANVLQEYKNSVDQLLNDCGLEPTILSADTTKQYTFVAQGSNNQNAIVAKITTKEKDNIKIVVYEALLSCVKNLRKARSRFCHPIAGFVCPRNSKAGCPCSSLNRASWNYPRISDDREKLQGVPFILVCGGDDKSICQWISSLGSKARPEKLTPDQVKNLDLETEIIQRDRAIGLSACHSYFICGSCNIEKVVSDFKLEGNVVNPKSHFECGVKNCKKDSRDLFLNAKPIVLPTKSDIL